MYQQSVTVYGNSLASVCSYLIFIILNEPYYVKFAYGASGAFFAYVALAYSLDEVEDSEKINARLSYVISVVSAIAISCNDALGAIAQMLCIIMYDSVRSQISLAVAGTVTSICVVLCVKHVLHVYQTKKEHLRKLQSHAVMNAYVTVKD